VHADWQPCCDKSVVLHVVLTYQTYNVKLPLSEVQPGVGLFGQFLCCLELVNYDVV
jgi:hypothetical protein